MLVVFRTDSSPRIGSGHFMRCLALADALRKQGVFSIFISRKLSGNLNHWIREAGHELIELEPPTAGLNLPLPSQHDYELWLEVPQTQDSLETFALLKGLPERPACLVLDHYALDSTWETYMRPLVEKIFVIDDLANRKHDCDLLLDQTSTDTSRYAGLIPADCQKFLGPKYALLRPEFSQLKNTPPPSPPDSRLRLLCFFGSADPANTSAKALSALERLPPERFHVDIILGTLNPLKDALLQQARRYPHIHAHEHVDSIATMMRSAHLFLGSGGTSTWERCCLGLPSLVVAVAENQEYSCQELAQQGVITYLGTAEQVSGDSIYEEVQTLAGNQNLMNLQSARGQALVDGQGARRIAENICARKIEFRRATREDIWALYEWRNAPENRLHFFQSEPVSREAHESWLNKSLQDPDCALLLAICDSRTVGVLRFNLSGDSAKVSIHLVPGEHGQGYGQRILRAGSAWVKHNLPQVRRLVAEIKIENEVSRKAFTASGYLEENSVFVKKLGV